MRRVILFALLISLLSSCEKDEEYGTLSLLFSANYAGDAFKLLEGYPVTDDFDMQFTKSDFYISNVSLVKENGEEVLLSDIEFIDISNNYSTANGSPVQYDYFDIPQDNYTALKFGLGVAPELNSTVPADYNSSHPLARTSHYWDLWNSYIFSKLEGRLDTAGNGNFDTSFLYHTGKTEFYRLVTFNAPIQISDDNMNLMLSIDYKEVVAPTGGSPIPVIDSPINHNPNSLEAFEIIISNFLNAMTLAIQ